MAGSSELDTVKDEASCGGLLPVDPFTALRFHFGMLLGVDDFETEQAYHRGKLRLHNAWLHREGVAWGFGVALDPGSGELRVERGLAYDRLGNELHLDATACLNLGAWYDQHADDPYLAGQPSGDQGEGGGYGDAGGDQREGQGGGYGYGGGEGGPPPGDRVRFDAHVQARFRSCLDRQVPALSEPCAGSSVGSAYSRVVETVELRLVPGRAPGRPRPGPYHRLRLLFMLEDPIGYGGDVADADQEVLEARRQILELPPEQQPAAYLRAFRRFAALDGLDLEPAPDPPPLFPAAEGTWLDLADVRGVTLQGRIGSWRLIDGRVDPTVRPAHVATATIQELLCGPLFRSRDEAADAGGPRVRRQSVRLRNRTITMTFDRPLRRASVSAEPFSVTTFGRYGWNDLEVRQASYRRQGSLVTLNLRETPEGDALRLIARGTGDEPLLGEDLVPMAGVVGGPPGSLHDGHDFVHMMPLEAGGYKDAGAS
jgi:hypothetical protein